MDLTTAPRIGRAGRASLADQLYRDLRGRIRSSALRPGDRLPSEKEFVTAFGVSRTTVREAIARLASEGLVQARQGTGVYVTDDANYSAFQITRDELSNIEDVRKLLELRLAIETEMAGMAAERRTPADVAALRQALQDMHDAADPDASALADSAFHIAIARAAHNHYFERILEFLGTRLVPPRSLVLQSRTVEERAGYSQQLDWEHSAILEAIATGDNSGARTALRHHLTQSVKRHKQTEVQAKSSGDDVGVISAPVRRKRADKSSVAKASTR